MKETPNEAQAMRILRQCFMGGLLLLFASGCLGFNWGAQRISQQEWEDWFAQHESKVHWVGYQGSDVNFHYFVARIERMGDWKFIEVRREKLVLEDERPWSSDYTGPLYHYRVDPTRNYQKITAPP